MPSKREVPQFIMKGFIQSIYACTSSLSLNITEKENILPTNPFQKITSSVNNTVFVIPLEAAFPPAHPPATHRTASSFSPPIMLSTPFKTSSSWFSHDSLGLTTTFASACSFGIRSMDPTHYSQTISNSHTQSNIFYMSST